MRRKLFLSLVLLASSHNALAFQEAGRAEENVAPARAATARSIPHTVRFAGRVDADGAPSAAVTFALYSDQHDSTPLWVETQNVQLDDQGRYTVMLGAASKGGLPIHIFAAGEARWLGVRLAEPGGLESPRVALVSVPYALVSSDAQTLGGRPAADYQLTRAAALASGETMQTAPETGGTITSSGNTAGRLAKFTATDAVGDSQVFDNGNVGIGTTAPTDKLHVNGAIRFGLGTFTPGVGKFYADPQHGTLLTATTGSSNDLGLVATTGQLLLTNPTGTNDLSFASGGKFGINILNPSEPLHVNGAIRFGLSTYDAGIPKLFVSAEHGSVLSGTAGTQNDLALVSRVGNLLLTNPTNTNNLVFFAGGNFGLNTFTPSSLLDVNGQIRTTAGIKFGDGSIQTTAATGGGGDITAVTAGSGLSGGGTSGDVSLSVNTALIQSRITGTCATGQYVRIVNQDGTVTCGTDATGGGGGTGTVTSVSIGQGLTGTANPITTSGTISANFTTAGGDNGSAVSMARGDHLHDGRYVQISPQSFNYSNASVNGKYAFTEFGGFASGSAVYVRSGYGTVTANGSGAITGGSLTETSSFGYTCTFSLSGTYSVNSSGLGSVSLTFTNLSGGCGNSTQGFTVQVAQQGSSVLLTEATTTVWTSVVALRQ